MADPQLIPVDHDPFVDQQRLLTPVDHDPFASDPMSFPPSATPKQGQSIAPSAIQPTGNYPAISDFMRQAGMAAMEPAKQIGEVVTGNAANPWANIGMAALGLAAPEAKGAAVAEEVAPNIAKAMIRAYHGSPHDFDRFDLSKIGTGEGAQAYGHGLYFAENEGTAKSYRDVLSGQSRIPGSPIGRSRYMIGDVDVPQGMSGHKALDTSNDIDLMLGTMKDNPDSTMIPFLKQQVEARIGRWSQEREAMLAKGYGGGSADEDMAALSNFYHQHVKNADPAAVREKPPGRMYEVNINADPEHFLDWDKPLSEQHPKVKQYIKDRVESLPSDEPGPRRGGKHILQSLVEQDANGGELYGRLAYKTGAFPEIGVQDHAIATSGLREAGIPGIKYADQGSRQQAFKVDLSTSKGPYSSQTFPTMDAARKYAADKEAEGFKADVADHGTRNFVVFDDKLIDIARKYGIPAMIAAGAAHYSLQPVDHDPFEQ